MKRSIQEIVELVVFGLIAVLVGTGVLWLVGWLIGLIGSLFMWLAGILWLVLRYIIPVFVILGAIYYLFRVLQNRNRTTGTTSEPVVSGPRPEGSSAGTPASSDVAPAAAPVTTPPVQGLPYNPDGPAAAAEPETTPPESTVIVEEVEIVDPEPVQQDDVSTDSTTDESNDKKA